MTLMNECYNSLLRRYELVRIQIFVITICKCGAVEMEGEAVILFLSLQRA